MKQKILLRYRECELVDLSRLSAAISQWATYDGVTKTPLHLFRFLYITEYLEKKTRHKNN